MMSSLTISLMLSLALPTSAVVRGTVLSPVRGGAEDIASMIKSIMERRASQPVELMSAGEGQRQSSSVEREAAAELPPSSTAASPASSPSSGTPSPPAPQAEQQPAELPAAGSDASSAPSPAPSPAPLQRAASEPCSDREALPRFLRHHHHLLLVLLSAAGLTALGGGLVLRRRRRCKRCGGALTLLGDEALSEGQRVEQRLGSVRYRLRECRPCGVIFRSWRQSVLRGRDVCPDCGFHTLRRKTTRFRAPTCKRPGVERVEISCAYCAYHRAREEVLPQLEGGEEL